MVFFDMEDAVASKKVHQEISVLNLTKEQQKLIKIMGTVPETEQKELYRAIHQLVKIVVGRRDLGSK